MPDRKKTDVLGTYHGKVLQDMVKDIKHLKMIDLGCGNQGVKGLFDDYTGVDLPEFDVYESDLTFIEDYDLVLMNAFIDVMEHPLEVLEKVLKHCKNYVLIHRQELTTKGKTRVTKEKAYGGWTYHSIINEVDLIMAGKGFKILDAKKLNFDNWEDGGHSILMKRIRP